MCLCRSVRITVRKFGPPVPRGLDDGFERRVFWLPSERALQLLIARDKNGGVAGATRRKLVRDFSAGDAFGHLDHLKIRITAGGAYVESLALNTVDLFQREHVGIRDIQNVNKVANAGSV